MFLRFRIEFTILLALILSGEGYSQSLEKWTLKACIQYAIEQNPQAAQARLQLDRNKANLVQTKGNVFPAINGQANHTYNTGRRIDPYTNQFANSVVLSQNFSLSGNVTLFSGLQNTHSIQAGKFAVQSSKASNEQTNNDIALNVANAFLQIMLNEELTLISTNQAQLSKQQAGRLKLLYEAGQITKGDYLQAEAQTATEELNQTNARNRLALSKLTLAQMLNLEQPEGFEIEQPQLNEPLRDLPPLSSVAIFNQAVDQYPAVRSADLQYLSQEKMLKASRSALSPSLSAFGGIGTGYSQLSRTQVGSTMQQQYIGEFQGNPLYIDVQVPVFEKTSFQDQWSQNFNRTVGFSLNVPIFNNFRTRTQISLQKISLENARLQKLIARNNLRRDIQTAWFDARAAYEKYIASDKNVKAQQEAFAYIQQRFDAGAINSFEYHTGKNQLHAAQSNLAQAKYEYIFRLLVLDFYQGKPIEF